VHSVLAGEGVAARTVAVSGCGPIGLFAIAVARACGAAQVFALEVNGYRRRLAELMKADFVLDPATDDVPARVRDHTRGQGVDVLLEMAGYSDAIRLGFRILRPGGRVSLLGIPQGAVELDLAQDIIFKGATVLGISGRRMYRTWFEMQALLRSGKLDLHPVITERIALRCFSQAMDRLRGGEAGKILLYPQAEDAAALSPLGI